MDDLGPNKQRLFEVCAQADPGDVLVDIGVRFGVSSQTMLDATKNKGCRVVGVDIGASPFPIRSDYTFLQCDSVSAAKLIPDNLYLVFFDTIHVKEQVMAELFHYWPKIRVGGWAVFHDTEWGDKRDHFLGRDWEPPMEGVRAFFGQIVETREAETTRIAWRHHPVSWGMSFVQKLTDWTPEIEGMAEALEQSKRLTESLCK